MAKQRQGRRTVQGSSSRLRTVEEGAEGGKRVAAMLNAPIRSHLLQEGVKMPPLGRVLRINCPERSDPQLLG